MRTIEIIKSIDWVLYGAALLLVAFSLAMLFSSIDTSEILSSRFSRQSLAFILATVITLIFSSIPYHIIKEWSIPTYAIGVTGLIFLLFAGRVIRGTTSRFTLVGFQLQPSEFMKIALIIALAWFFSRYTRASWRTTLVSGIITAIPAGLIMLEPDIGVTSLFIFLWALILVFVGTPWRNLFLLALAGLVAVIPTWLWLLAGYQKDRILTFMDPASDPLGAGYNIVQSIIAFGSGHIWGRGLGHGPQSQLQFLPERHTDFILASIGEELGYIGVTVVLILYFIILWRILLIARSTQDKFGQLIAVATFILLLASLLVNAGMNMGLLPVTGIPLPLLSYGGSNLVSTFLLLGLVQSVRVYNRWLQRPPVEISDFV